MRNRMRALCYRYQADLIQAFESIDGGAFRKDPVNHMNTVMNTAVTGITGVIDDGRVIERGGINVSEVTGPLSTGMARTLQLDITDTDSQFYAVGISAVIHPRNPFVPTMHFNWRYFEVGETVWWFGGGADLTPYYIIEDDCQLFHTAQKVACDAVDTALYPVLKAAADAYFYLPFRQEHRGVGGTFYMKKADMPPEALYELAACGLASIWPGYGSIMQERYTTPYTKAHQNWQWYRRGRYVEFNLLQDVGTQFGLNSGGRTESILVSLPRHALWEYDRVVPADSPESKLMAVVQSPRDWV